MNFKSVGVIGAGNIGTGVVTDLVLHEVSAVVLDVSTEILERAKVNILKNIRFAPLLSQNLPRLNEEDALKRMRFTTRRIGFTTKRIGFVTVTLVFFIPSF